MPLCGVVIPDSMKQNFALRFIQISEYFDVIKYQAAAHCRIRNAHSYTIFSGLIYLLLV